MTLRELIAKLQSIEEQHGDMDVKVFDRYGPEWLIEVSVATETLKGTPRKRPYVLLE